MTKILHKLNIGIMSAFCAALVLGSINIFSPEALAQIYPTKPIRIVVTSGPGSTPDLIARLVGSPLAEALGQKIIIDNRPGASGRIGAEIAARSAPDGYTLMMITSQLASVDAMYKNLRYNLAKDFAPISLVGTAASILVVNPSVPATTVKELVTLAKSRPGTLKYGSGGSGSATHLNGAFFAYKADIKILHVPYKSSIAAVTGTMTGEVDIIFQASITCMPLVKSGKLRALGVTSAKRTPLVPDLPPISEAVPGYEFTLWQSLFAPAKTPPAILSKLNTEVVKAMNTSVVREKMTGLGYEPQASSQQGLALFSSEQLEKMREAVKLSGARPED